MSKIKRLVLLLIFIIAFSCIAFAKIKVDGQFNDWSGTPKMFKDKQYEIESTRSGIDFLAVSMRLDNKYLYLLIKGVSVTGGKLDKGASLSDISIRMSFVSASNPLNRMRIATEPGMPGVIKVSEPSAKTKQYGGIKDRYWMFGRINRKIYGIEIKIPVFSRDGNTYIGAYGGPIIYKKVHEKKRRRLCDVFITNVNTRNHLFVDKMDFYFYNNTF